MRRWYTILGCLLVLSGMAWGQSATGVNIGRGPMYNPQFWMWQSPDNKGVGLQWMEQVEELLGSESTISAGAKIWYVDSGVANEGDGSNWDNAYNTIQEAIDASDADSGDNRGDIIKVAQNHAENFTGAVTVDVAGLTIEGIGTGADMPTFTSTDTDGAFSVTVANVTMKNLRFETGISAVVTAIALAAGGDNFTLAGCEFVSPATATYEFYDMITWATGADNSLIIGNRFISTVSTTGCNQALNLDTGIVDGLRVIGNEFQGNWVVAAIHSSKACTNVFVAYNEVYQSAAGQFGIEFTSTSTGMLAYNNVYTDALATCIDPGSLACFENRGINTIDLSSVLVPPLPAIGTVTAGSAEDILKKLYYGTDGTGAYPATLANDSALAMIIAKGSTATPSTYTNTTDSLEAIADHVQTLITTAAGTGVYPTGVTDDSIIAMILGDDAVATAASYNNTTDSLEAIANHVQTLITTAAGTDVYPSGVTNDSIIAMILSKSATAAASSYNNTTDSLEALGDAATAMQTDLNAMDSETEWADLSSAVVDNIVSAVDANSTMTTLVNDILAGLRMAGVGVGNVFYVDSATGSDADTGATWALAEATLSAAIGDCTSNKGDIIFVAPGHAETLADAQITVNKDGIRIIGLGEGVDRPQIAFQHANSSIDVTGASVRFTGLDFYSTTAATAIGLHITGADCVVEDCLFSDTGDFEFAICITLGADAERTTIQNNRFLSGSGTTGATACIDLNTGVVDRCVIVGNRIVGDFSTAAISSNQINTNMLIKDNVIDQANSGDWCIELTGASTGECVNNRLYADARATCLDPGSLKCTGNIAVDAIDESGWPIPNIGDNTDNYIGTNSADNDAATTSVAANGDGSVLERQEYGQTMMEKTISKTLSTIANGNNDLFAVAGGPIKLTEIVTYVTTTPIAAEGCLIGYNIDPTTPATDTAFGTDGTALECNNAAVGSVLIWDGVLADDLVKTANGVALGTPTFSGLIIPPGSIELNAAHDGSCAGEVTVYMRYIPLSTSSVVTAAP